MAKRERERERERENTIFLYRQSCAKYPISVQNFCRNTSF